MMFSESDKNILNFFPVFHYTQHKKTILYKYSCKNIQFTDIPWTSLSILVFDICPWLKDGISKVNTKWYKDVIEKTKNNYYQ